MPITLKEQKGNLTVQPPYMATSSGGSGVSSVNGQTGRVVLDIPSKVSELENDLGYLTEHQSLDALATKEALNSGLAAKQDKLTAGENITIQNNVISASGGSSLPISPYNERILYYRNDNVEWCTFDSILQWNGLNPNSLNSLQWQTDAPTSSSLYNAKELAFIAKILDENRCFSAYYNFRYLDSIWSETTLGVGWAGQEFYIMSPNGNMMTWSYNGAEMVYDTSTYQIQLVAYRV